VLTCIRSAASAGTRRTKYLEENLSAAAIVLSAEELAELSQAFAPEAVSGQRYDQANMSATFHYGSDSKK
jgi:hypothetical protein